MIPFIDLKTQFANLESQIRANIDKVLEHGSFILGPEVQEFEKKLADFAGVKHCIGVSSGTDALLIALMANKVGPGDAVFTTPFTFIATAEVISLLGATPIFVDIDPQTYNIDPGKLELAIRSVITKDPAIYPIPHIATREALIPKAIIPVDLYGLPADYTPIMDLAEEHGLFVLSDSAQGFGSMYQGRRTAAIAHATTTSFFPAKPLGCYGDGGAVLTDDDELAAGLTSIRVHGKGKDKYDNIRIGLNARLHTLQAAILLTKLEVFQEELDRRQSIAQKYTTFLSGLEDSIITPYMPPGLQSAWAQYTLLARTGNLRNKIQAQLLKRDIPSMIYYATPLHMQTAFKSLGYSAGDFPISLDTSQKVFSIPMHPYLDDNQVSMIADALKKSLE